MNERIEQLAREAGFKHPDHVGLSEEYAYFDHLKFAELIVRECANHIMTSSDRYRKDHFAHKILEHFGVEE